jgi:hypothetical protein
MMFQRTRFFSAFLGVISVLALSGCGGGGGGGSDSNVYSATCTDGTIRTSTLSVADAQSQCASSTALATERPSGSYPTSVDKLSIFNELNSNRLQCGFGSVKQNEKLDIAAQGHADYLALNNVTVGHTQITGSAGFTGSSIADRFLAATYPYSFGSEVVGISAYGTWYSNNNTSPYPYSATEVSALNSFRSLYATVYHLVSLMGGQREIGIGISNRNTSFGNTTSGLKLVVIDQGTQTGNANQQITSDSVVTFPCEGTTGLMPLFGEETPDPFPLVNHDTTAYGQPVYVASASGTTLTLTNAVISLHGGAQVPSVELNKFNDPQNKLLSNQIFIVPTVGLQSNAIYDVTLTGTNTGLVSTSNIRGSFTRSFSFQTGTFTGPQN